MNCTCGHSIGEHTYTGWCRHLECTTTDCKTFVPCECGSTEAYWHGRQEAVRTYCCDACWDNWFSEEAKREQEYLAEEERAKVIKDHES